MATYKFEFDGTAAQGQTWKATGTTASVPESDLNGAIDDAMRQSFMQITSGKAIFGKPGVGCHGPYRIAKLVLERNPDA